MESEFRYIVAYMGGVSYEGIREAFIPVRNLNEASLAVDKITEEHEFWKVSICQILDTYESPED